MAEGSERRSSSSRGRLHNFTLPGLKWGAQRTLRCMNIEPISGHNGSKDDSHLTDRSQPEANRMVERPQPVESPVVNSSHRISRFRSKKVREEGMLEIQEAAERMKISTAQEKEKGKGKDISVSELPWKLRTRRATSSAPEVNGGGSGGGSGSGSDGERGTNYNLWSPGWRRDGRLRAAVDEKLNMPKFSFTLTKEEIESDFIAMTGAKPPKKPQKRPKVVQKTLNELAPGMWLKEVTPETYKVTGDPQPRKGRK